MCIECKRMKPINQYYNSRIEIDGYFHTCVKCCEQDNRIKKTFTRNIKRELSHYRKYFTG